MARVLTEEECEAIRNSKTTDQRIADALARSSVALKRIAAWLERVTNALESIAETQEVQGAEIQDAEVQDTETPEAEQAPHEWEENSSGFRLALPNNRYAWVDNYSTSLSNWSVAIIGHDGSRYTGAHPLECGKSNASRWPEIKAEAETWLHANGWLVG